MQQDIKFWVTWKSRGFLIQFVRRIALPEKAVLFSCSLDVENAVIGWRTSPVLNYDEMG